MIFGGEFACRHGRPTHPQPHEPRQEGTVPGPTHGRRNRPDTYGAVHGSRDPRRIKLPPRGACVDVTPNLVWIAQVGDRVQLLHDRGHVLAHEAEDVVTKVRTRPKGTRAPPGRLRVRSVRSRDSSRRSVIACEAMKRRSAARIGVNVRDSDQRGDVADNRPLITDQTQGLLSRGSQVRILPGAPFS